MSIQALILILASAIAVIGILSAFKKLLASVETHLKSGQLNRHSLQQEQTRFFIRVALIEIIPIFLIVTGFMLADPTAAIDLTTVIALIVIVGLVAFAIVNVFVAKNDMMSSLTEDSKDQNTLINSLTMLGIMLISSIPIISVVALLM